MPPPHERLGALPLRVGGVARLRGSCSSISQRSLRTSNVPRFLPMQKSSGATARQPTAVAMPARANIWSTRPCGVPQIVRCAGVNRLLPDGGRASSQPEPTVPPWLKVGITTPGRLERVVSEFTRLAVRRCCDNATPVASVPDCVAERARVRHRRGEGSAARAGRRRVAGRVLGMERGDQVRDLLRMGREREVAGVE